ncbi:hypothetical protein Fmac_010496 [Flemingia macrophylla]|uniref:Disease resistance protein n=1 Tax=Flemingia macrophylla TaxID=520843 RepID=A0ABD1MLW5_9FABA
MVMDYRLRGGHETCGPWFEGRCGTWDESPTESAYPGQENQTKGTGTSTLLEIVDKVIGYVLKPFCKQVAYIVHYKQNVHELNHSVELLGREKERLKHQVDEADKNLQNIEGKVTDWLWKLDEFESEFEKFKNVEGHTNSRFPHLWNRHRLGRQAKKMTMEVKHLVDEFPKSDEVAYKENVTSNVVTFV